MRTFRFVVEISLENATNQEAHEALWEILSGGIDLIEYADLISVDFSALDD